MGYNGYGNGGSSSYGGGYGGYGGGGGGYGGGYGGKFVFTQPNQI